MQTQNPSKLIVLGSGNFGTCLALHLTRLGHHVLLWSRSPEVCQKINATHHNPKYLSHIKLPNTLEAFHELDAKKIASASMIVLAIPTQALREVLLKLQGKIKLGTILVCAAKGIEVGTLKFPLEIIGEVLGPEIAKYTAVLSGPSFAIEIAEEQPTAVSVAAHELDIAHAVQEVFHSPRFRVYTGDDPMGLEVAGALKNVFAIASGASSGLGFQANSQAALITRGLAEMTRIGLALGANPITFKGLGGVGDLFLTCTSQKSRNFTVGYRLGKGEKLADVLATVGSVAEGVTTAKSAYELCKRLGVRAPITGAAYQVLYGGASIVEMVNALTAGDAKEEHV
jgi:glycerol-3-phosphate dehydrogenase (NAD(P)+)